MDIVHHALIGGAGLLGTMACNDPLAGAAFVAGSVFPDLDAAFMLFGKRFYLRNHQGITHSLVLAPVYALLLSGLLWALPGIDWSWTMYAGALAGLVLHLVLDWLNTFRIALFAPFVRRRFSADAVFFVDGVALTLTALFYLLYGYFEYQAALWLYPALFAAYLGAKGLLHRSVSRKLRALSAIPSALNPFAFYILEAQGEARVAYLYHALTGTRSHQRIYHPAGAEYQKLAGQSSVFRDMARVTRAFQITEVVTDGSGTLIRAADIAVRNFGGRFGQTELRFDPTGKLIHEVANI